MVDDSKVSLFIVISLDIGSSVLPIDLIQFVYPSSKSRKDFSDIFHEAKKTTKEISIRRHQVDLSF